MELVMTEIPSLCLNMIVKNESHIIKDTLTKLCNKVQFDYWVISDTGSTDNTKDIIINFFAERNIPGEMFDDEWVDFGHNRTKALEHAFKKSKYLFVFDADDELCGNFHLPLHLNKDCYLMKFGNDTGIRYDRTQIVNNRKKWKYLGVLHEYIACAEQMSENGAELIEGDYYVISGRKGSRNKDENKYLNDALILEKAYEIAVKNNDEIYNRYGYYCANSFFDFGKYEEAIKWYKITLCNKNWNQEKYMCCLQLFQCYTNLKQPETGMYYLVKAFSYDKERVECLYELVFHYCINGLFEVAYSYYQICKPFYETYLTTTYKGKHMLEVGKADLFLPYYMILIGDKMKDPNTVIHMYKIIFTKKYTNTSTFYIGNMLYNLQFFIHNVEGDQPFLQLFKNYISFLLSIQYNVFQHDFMTKYEKYGIVNPTKTAITTVFNTFSQENKKCLQSNKILFYTGFAPYQWNHTYASQNSIGGSESAVIYLAKSFPKSYDIYIAGDVAQETHKNIHFINNSDLYNFIASNLFHTIIVSRYVGFFEMYPHFVSSTYQTYIWAHDIRLLPYGSGTNLSVQQILQKWSANIRGCICQTEWHKQLFLSQYPELANKIHIINNGIDCDTIKKYYDDKKCNNRFVYTSCTERGLDRLLELWPSITEAIPDAELYISTYNPFPRNDEERRIQNTIDSFPNVTHLGKLNKQQLYTLMASAEYWLYPTHFNETSCITAMEMLMAEVVCIYYPVAGLVNTVGEYGIPVNKGTEIDTILKLTETNKNSYRKKGREYALSCDWSHRASLWESLLKLNL